MTALLILGVLVLLVGVVLLHRAGVHRLDRTPGVLCVALGVVVLAGGLLTDLHG